MSGVGVNTHFPMHVAPDVGNLMQGNVASSCQSGGFPSGMCPGAGLNPRWNGMATNQSAAVWTASLQTLHMSKPVT